MSTFVGQRSVLRNIVLSPKSQTTIGEVFADASLTYLCRAESQGFLQLAPEKESDYEYTSKGSSMATESREIALSSSGELNTRLDDFLAGWLFAFVMGTDAFTAGADSAPNTHVFTWKDTSDPAVLTNIYAEDSAGLKRKWSDLSITSIVLSGTDKGSIKVKATFMGLGTVTADVVGVMATLPDLPVAQYLYGSDSVISIGPSGAPVSKSPRVLSWEATFDHANILFRACGTGVKPAFVRQGNPLNKLKLVVAIDSSTDIFDWMTGQTPLEISIAVNSGATSLLIDYPNVILPKSDLMEQDKYVAYTVELDENSILQPTGGGESVTVTLQNTDVAYLTAV
jgi:hypothetical protein